MENKTSKWHFDQEGRMGWGMLSGMQPRQDSLPFELTKMITKTKTITKNVFTIRRWQESVKSNLNSEQNNNKKLLHGFSPTHEYHYL